MSSTFSTSLKLELIGNGDQSGTWGTTTNTNLGTLLEQAITGVESITMTNADYTLTNLNGASDEARNAVLVIGGTNSAIRNVIAPAVNKLYVIKNATVGGYAVVIKTSASTGVSIPNGSTLSVYCDGSEFYLSTAPYDTTNVANTLVYRDGSGNFAAGTITTTTQSIGDNTTKAATTAFVQTALQILYPVGAIYSSTSATNPGTAFGFGTWVAFGAGRVLIGNGGGYSAGATGGSADAVVVSHDHTASSSVSDPGHSHSYATTYFAGGPGPIENGGEWRVYDSSGSTSGASTGISVSTSITSSGVSGTGANLQPYVVVYMWNRTA